MTGLLVYALVGVAQRRRVVPVASTGAHRFHTPWLPGIDIFPFAWWPTL